MVTLRRHAGKLHRARAAQLAGDVYIEARSTFVTPIIPDTVTAYLGSLTRPGDELLEEVRLRSKADGIPAVVRETGALLQFIASLAGAERILEIGTGYGYSTIWLARALPPTGRLFSMERDPARAAIAREYVARAGLADQISVIVGDATRFLAKVAGPFDVIFQDADKAMYLSAYDRVFDLLKPGGALITDNVLWGGDVVPGFEGAAGHPKDTIAAIATYNERLGADTRLHTIFLPVGDGVAVSMKKRASDEHN